MTYYVIENRMGIRVICHYPRRDERVLAECRTADEAFAELRINQRAQWDREASRDAWKALAVIALIIIAAAIVPDLEPQRPAEGINKEQMR